MRMPYLLLLQLMPGQLLCIVANRLTIWLKGSPY